MKHQKYNETETSFFTDTTDSFRIFFRYSNTISAFCLIADSADQGRFVSAGNTLSTLQQQRSNSPFLILLRHGAIGVCFDASHHFFCEFADEVLSANASFHIHFVYYPGIQSCDVQQRIENYHRPASWRTFDWVKSCHSIDNIDTAFILILVLHYFGFLFLTFWNFRISMQRWKE